MSLTAGYMPGWAVEHWLLDFRKPRNPYLKGRMNGAGISIANDRRSDASIGIHHEGGEDRIAKVLFGVPNAERLPMMWDCFGICAGSSVAQRTANKLR
jgi:hypothetical protein